MTTTTTPAGPKDELSTTDVTLINRLFGDDPNFALWRAQAGFSPVDLVRNLGDYLAQLSSRSQNNGLLGFTSFVAPAPALAASDSVSDEFDSASLNSAWTRFHTLLPTAPQRGATFAAANSARESISTLRPGWYLAQSATDGGTCGLTKAVTDAAETLGIYYCRFSMDASAATPSSGDIFYLMLAETVSSNPDPDNYILVSLTRSSTAHTWTLAMQSEVDNGGTTTQYTQALTSFAQPVSQLAIALVADNTWMGFVGTDDGCWKYLGTLSSSAFAPNRLALAFGISSNSTPCPVFGVDYVRRELGSYATK